MATNSNRFQKVLVVAAFAISIAAFPLSVGAWSKDGHQVVGDVAFSLAKPETQAAITALIKSAQPSHSDTCPINKLADAAEWPDCIKFHGVRTFNSFHYDNVPFCEAAPAKGYCPNGVCASAKIAAELAILSDFGADPTARVEALAWVAHLTGDVHQPLHTVDDGGGNGVKVSYHGPTRNPVTEIHALWDDGLVVATVGYEDDPHTHQNAAYQPVYDLASQHPEWAGGDAKAWVSESHALATSAAYLVDGQSACKATSEALSPAYINSGKQVITPQLAKAAVRLATELDQAFGH